MQRQLDRAGDLGCQLPARSIPCRTIVAFAAGAVMKSIRLFAAFALADEELTPATMTT